MIMPKVIPEYLFAPCSMNCMVCYVHLKKKKPCSGCLGDDINKPERCKTCTIKACAITKGHKYCYECSDFPCKTLRNMEKSYIKRYGTSLFKNAQYAKENGITGFQKKEHKNWICKKCTGVVSLHDGTCSECGEKHTDMSDRPVKGNSNTFVPTLRTASQEEEDGVRDD